MNCRFCAQGSVYGVHIKGCPGEELERLRKLEKEMNPKLQRLAGLEALYSVIGSFSATIWPKRMARALRECLTAVGDPSPVPTAQGGEDDRA